MDIEKLLGMSEIQLRQEYDKAQKQNNQEYMIIINTMRIRRIILSALEGYHQNPDKYVEYYEHEGETYFSPQGEPDTLTFKGYIEWLILTYISSGNPVPFDLDLLEGLLPEASMEFKRLEKELTLRTGIVNGVKL